MSTHNICIHREIRKKLCGYPLLSVAMVLSVVDDGTTTTASEFAFESSKLVY